MIVTPSSTATRSATGNPATTSTPTQVNGPPPTATPPPTETPTEDPCIACEDQSGAPTCDYCPGCADVSTGCRPFCDTCPTPTPTYDPCGQCADSCGNCPDCGRIEDGCFYCEDHCPTETPTPEPTPTPGLSGCSLNVVPSEIFPGDMVLIYVTINTAIEANLTISLYADGVLYGEDFEMIPSPGIEITYGGNICGCPGLHTITVGITYAGGSPFCTRSQVITIDDDGSCSSGEDSITTNGVPVHGLHVLISTMSALPQ
jgi:hypothetical protein